MELLCTGFGWPTGRAETPKSKINAKEKAAALPPSYFYPLNASFRLFLLFLLALWDY
ncbi:MAG: hypothetical protein H8E36_01360 [Rhodospirillaceae bacterium]|nr:hypothetical protein [Rhodospirillaceae bacterium]MBL6930436.1 hypothetical protein [Rhodospirillales bacterium]